MATPRWWEYPPRHAEVMELRAEQDSSPCLTCPGKDLSGDAEGGTPRTRVARMLRPMRHPDEASWFPERIILLLEHTQHAARVMTWIKVTCADLNITPTPG